MENVQQDNLFKSLWPGMIQHTRLLLVDYDVTRFHSFDMLMWQLYQDKRVHKMKGLEHFRSLKPELYKAVDPKLPLPDRITAAQQYITDRNIYALFSSPAPGIEPIHTTEAYEDQLTAMLAGVNEKQMIATELGNRLGIIFQRDDITGYILRYPDETYKPDFIDDMIVLKDPHILNPERIADVIQEHKINGVIISSLDTVVMTADILISRGYRFPITWITGLYGYNYLAPDVTGEKQYIQNHIPVIYNLILSLKYEFGTYDPFGGLGTKQLEEET